MATTHRRRHPMQTNNYTASCLDRSPTTTSQSLPPPRLPLTILLPSLRRSSVPHHRRATVKTSLSTAGHARADNMSHRLGRVVSDISHSNSRSVTTDHHSLHHQSATTTTSNNNEGGNVGKATKQKLSLLISSVVSLSWTRSESSGETGGREKNSSSRKQQEANGGTGGGRRRRGLEIVLAVRKYVAMVEQLLTSSYSASSSQPDVGSRRRDGRPHRFTSARHAGGNANAAAQSSSKRHRGRLSSAPASLRGSPATSGHLSVGESVTKASTTSSEVSTMEELQSAIQAAIAHCKNSVAAGGGGDKQQQQRKC